MSLIGDLSAALEATRRQQLRRYGELLAVAEGEKAVKELKSLMAALDKSEAEVRADEAIVRRARAASERVAALPADHAEQCRRADAAVAAHDAQTADLLRARRAEYAKLYNVACDLHERSGKAGQAREQLRTLRATHPDLLGWVGE